MVHKYNPVIIISIVYLFLVSCTHQQQGVVVGGLAGAGAGYLLGKDAEHNTKIASIVGGALAGGMIGGAIGEYMDESDQEEVRTALQSMPTKSKRNWTNSKTGNVFTIQPISDLKSNEKGQYRDAYIWGRKKGNKKVKVSKERIYL